MGLVTSDFPMNFSLRGCPFISLVIRNGKQFFGLHFFTRALPCLTELHSLFYPNGIKIIPCNIYELLTPIALAHMIMGDGVARPYGLQLCTESYSIQDTMRILNTLIIRYRLDCSLHLQRSGQYRIYIS